ncbi:zonular occludens toxin domain-containing protein [Pontibacterium granulatum]|uniref:zonular occludens toxin family protein n=1 Tax=Pontibacterium granulatum TaxID=2036029 RepID=UPI00249CC3BE|nr:zonular occludens toxin domain-containing protein [Pontibacterium granulatum]MDI3325406.1 zonular occludens toxin domain-containing protein [Pontibacterium granulatum]
MTTAIHHGPPGSFKSFGTVQRAMIPALKEGRTVVTNIRGFQSLERIEQALEIKLPPEAKIIYVEADKDKGFQAMARFFHWAPLGALIAIDETQRVWSKKRDAKLDKYDLKLTDDDGEERSADDIKRDCPLWDGEYERPETVENAFDQHRHYNWDIYCTTPNIAKVHPEVRLVAEIAYRHRGLGSLLPQWKNKWKEFPHDAESSGKQLSHYLGDAQRYTADQRVFACYQSTKTGKAKGTSEARPLYRDPKIQMFTAAFLGCLGYFIYALDHVLESNPIFNAIVSTDVEETGPGPAEVAGRPSGDGDRGHVDSTQYASAFDRLAPALTANTPEPVQAPAVESPKPSIQSALLVSDDPLGHYFSAGYDVRLAAAVFVPGRESLYYRVTVYQNGDRIDQFSQDEVRAYGYQEDYGAAGLRLRRGEAVFLVRPLVARRIRSSEPIAPRKPVITDRLSVVNM